jgi:hypothetical protein
MGTQDIAEWLINNPQAWFRLAELVAEQKPDYARQIARAFDDQAFLGVSNIGDWNE